MVKGSSRLSELDGLRGIAALGVVLHHYLSRYWDLVPAPPETPLQLAMADVFRPFQLGVQLFFIISGFVILLTLERTATMRLFAMHRAVRLLPAYVVCACLTAAVVIITGFNPMGLMTSDYLASATVVPLLLWKKPIDPSAWTLMHELAFYGMAAVAFYGFRLRRYEGACLAWLLVTAAAQEFGSRILGYKLTILLNVGYAPLFVAGMMLYLLYRRRGTPITYVTLLACLACMVRDAPLAEAFTCTVFIAIVWLASNGRLKPLGSPALVWLGAISYPLYLVHQIIGYGIIRTAREVSLSHGAGAAVAIACSIGLALAVHRLAELPVQRWAKRTALGGTRRGVTPKSPPWPETDRAV